MGRSVIEGSVLRSLAKLLRPHFTVFTFDRRGRGESTDTAPYSVEREVEDIAALIQEAGGSAYVFGTSSGAALALEAAARVNSIKKVAMYEAPFFFDEGHPPRPDEYLAKMTTLIAADRRRGAQTIHENCRYAGDLRQFDALHAYMAQVETSGAHAPL